MSNELKIQLGCEILAMKLLPLQSHGISEGLAIYIADWIITLFFNNLKEVRYDLIIEL